jgi:hypothetical protein
MSGIVKQSGRNTLFMPRFESELSIKANLLVTTKLTEVYASCFSGRLLTLPEFG